MSDEEQVKIPQSLKEGLTGFYLEAITGDVWTRVSSTGALLNCLTAVQDITKDKAEYRILFRAIANWNQAVDDASLTRTESNAVKLCAQITRAVSPMVFKYGKSGCNWFSKASMQATPSGDRR